jgi:UDP-GlcNAc:undecaprenyl-phosphate GlcNAc-1-phosphate transferase
MAGLVLDEPRLAVLAAGAALSFALGLVDDVRGLSARVKFVCQILIAVLVYAGGIRIQVIGVPGIKVLELAWLSLPATVFWVLLVVNAVNLLDGLDGLAAGTGLFVTLALLVLCVIGQRHLPALMLASLAGALLGFLRYNFNPATIFMGDSGSYFLGFMIASLSMLSSMKGQAAVTILIPVVAMGIPLADTLFAALRRYAQGRNLFSPDRGHVHHRLMAMGFSHRRAVLILYGTTLLMCLSALALVFLQDAGIAVLLSLLLLAGLGGVRRLGYASYASGERLSRWGKGVLDELGFNRQRRILHSHQLLILEAGTVEELWDGVVRTLEFLGLDYARFRLWDRGDRPGPVFERTWHRSEATRDPGVLYQHSRLYLRYPFEKRGVYFGTMAMSGGCFDSCRSRCLTLSHAEHLRRTVSEKLSLMAQRGLLAVPPGRVPDPCPRSA